MKVTVILKERLEQELNELEPVEDIEINVSVNSNWVHPPGHAPEISSKNLPGGVGI